MDLPAQYASLRDELAPAIEEVLSTAAYCLGPAVQRFEERFAAFVGTRHCVGVGSGTEALHLALLAAGVETGDEVVTVSHTFVATSWAIAYVGARPVFVDIDPETRTMGVAGLERAITPRTRAVVPVHLYGHPFDVDAISAVCRQHGLPLVEDAAQAQGARYRGSIVGGFGLAGCFSFYPGKNLGACGEAGAVCTNDDGVAARIRRLRDHAQPRRYVHEEMGFNYRMDGIQGAVLEVKLRHLEAWNRRRREIARAYLQRLADLPSLELPREAPWAETVWHQFVVLHERRNELQALLQQAGISSGLHYPTPIHLQPAFAHLGCGPGALPVTERVAARCLSLPMFPEMTDEQVEAVCEAVHSACASLDSRVA